MSPPPTDGRPPAPAYGSRGPGSVLSFPRAGQGAMVTTAWLPADRAVTVKVNSLVDVS